MYKISKIKVSTETIHNEMIPLVMKLDLYIGYKSIDKGKTLIVGNLMDLSSLYKYGNVHFRLETYGMVLFLDFF